MAKNFTTIPIDQLENQNNISNESPMSQNQFNTISMSENENINPNTKMSSEDFVAALQRESPFLYKVSKKISEHPRLQKSLENTSYFLNKSRLPAFAGGALEQTYNSMASMANLNPISLFSDKYRFPMYDIENVGGLTKTLPEDDITKYAISGGRIGGAIAPYNELMSVLGKASPYLRNIPGTMIRSGAVGFSQGENAPGGRAGGAALGMFGGLFEGLTDKGAIKILSRYKKSQELAHSKKYDEIAKEAENIPFESKIVRDKDFIKQTKRLRGNKTFLDSFDLNDSLPNNIQNYLKNPNYANAHALQSDLAIASNRGDRAIINAQRTGNRLSSSEKKGLQNVKDLRKEVQESILNTFKSAGRDDLANQYENIGKSYLKNVVPYKAKPLQEANIKKGYPGRISAEDAMKKLREDPYYYEALKGKHGKIMSRQFPKVAKGAALLGGGIAASEAGLIDDIAQLLSKGRGSYNDL